MALEQPIRVPINETLAMAAEEGNAKAVAELLAAGVPAESANRVSTRPDCGFQSGASSCSGGIEVALQAMPASWCD